MVLRIASYNIRHGHDVDLDMAVLAQDILATGADIVGLQEVDVCTSRVHGCDTLAQLATALGWEHYRFCRAIDFAGGGYGTAILSRYPISSFEITHFDVPAPFEGRATGHAVIDADGERVDFFNTHLSYESDELRADQFAAWASLVSHSPAWILTGDFNTADLAHFSVLGDALLANPGRYPTFPASGEGIDNIVCASPWHIANTGVLQNHHSDHLLLWAELTKPRSRAGVEPNCPRAIHFRIFRRAFTRKIGILLRKIPPKSIKNAFALGCEQF